MAKLVLLLGAVLIVKASCQHYILPTYRPPRTQTPIIRTVRDTHHVSDVQLDPTSVHSIFADSPSVMEDSGYYQNQRNVRSVDSPSAKRGGGSSRTSSGSRDTGPTHPGHNRRNARSIKSIPLAGRVWPPQPSPYNPLDENFQGDRQNPFNHRTVRGISYQDAFKKPTDRDVIIPNWNPNARTKPWQAIGVRGN